MNSRKPGRRPAVLRSSSTESSPRTSSAFDESEDDEKAMADMGYIPSRPLTVQIPRSYGQGPYCPRKPSLNEILANKAPAPWTLSAFMAYLSHNHCLETLEFTMDASRYRKHYNKMANRSSGTPISPLSEECTYVKMLWQRLLDAYIAPNGPREVNLPSDVRDQLLALSNPYAPPHPSILDPAVEKVYELMEDSVLVPFINSLCPQSSHAASAFDASEENLHSHTRSYDERALYRRQRDREFEPLTAPTVSTSPNFNRASAPSSLSGSFSFARGIGGAHTRFSPSSNPSYGHRHHPSSTGPSSYGSTYGGIDAMTDDSGSMSNSPCMSALGEPMTPPTTPPTSEYGFGFTSGTTPSPKSSRGESHGSNPVGNWGKRVSSKLGWKKKSGGALREDELEGMF